MKTDVQWRVDNGIPPDARWSPLYDGWVVILMVNKLLKPYGLRIRTKHRRGDTGSYIWLGSI